MKLRKTGPVAILVLLAASPAAAAEWTLSAEAWARPRHGAAVAAMEPLPTVIEAWSRRDGAKLVVRYAGGEAGELWAAELADWLVALGVPGSDIVTVPGGRPGRLEFGITREDAR